MRRALVLACLLLAACGSRQPSASASEETSVPKPVSTARFGSDKPLTAPKVIRYTAHGTEPFWGVDLDGDMLTYSDPEVSGISATVSKAGDLAWTGTLGGKPLQFRLEKRACSDGMSDRTYDYAADVKIGERMLLGCAEEGGH